VIRTTVTTWRHVLAPLLLLACAGLVQAQQEYQKAPKEIRDILDAAPTPVVSVSPDRQRLLFLYGERHPAIDELAEPMLRLAGLRINPRNNGPHRPPRFVSGWLQALPDGAKKKVALPADAHLGFPSWAPDGKRFAFTNTTFNKIELHLAESAGAVKRVEGLTLNSAVGQPFHWMPGSQTLLCQTIVKDRPPPPGRRHSGPTIQESFGKPSPVRTFQDLLQNAHDEDLFDYYATSQLALCDPANGKVTAIGKPGIFTSVAPAPDGKHILVTRLRRPYSYLLPAFAFPKDIEVWDLKGKVVHGVASLPLADQVPIDGVPTGPRHVHWRPTDPATLVWVEALDDGDPRKKVKHRDQLRMRSYPFKEPDIHIGPFFMLQQRFAGIAWSEGGQALIEEFERDKRWERTHLVNVAKPKEPARLVWDRSVHDRYRDPGKPVTRMLPSGQRIVREHNGGIFLIGEGASPKGDRPFLDRLELATLKTTRLFQPADKCYETVVALLAPDGSQLLTRHEAPTDPPNYFLRVPAKDTKTALTKFADPYPQLRHVKKELVTYKRPDGVSLSFTLYLPPNHKKGERLPAVLWAYPREFVDASTAGQVSGSSDRFTTIGGTSHLFFLLQGYAVLDGATMPVVGDPETVNNTYIEQIVASAKAAIDKADEMGVIDKKRVGVGGHSYGAFMTANLLAHSDLFRAGIARSGAYNRSLTPFGFQSERRTFWQAPEMYFKVSPFMHAHKIKAPILLMHGEVDNNSGTFPMQSERMYHAIKGNGGTVRYVTLPHESHGYLARESVEHTLYEMLSWFDRYVKNAPTTSSGR
jgi:dipeptidyl aminopeptidase/acylaminoacyl peptidase